MPYKLVIFDVSGTLTDGYGSLYPGVKGCLDSLRSAGVDMALATNLSVDGLEHFLEQYDLQEYFSSYKSAQSTAYKPHPLMIEEILLEMGIDCASVLMVGDTAGDIHMAHNAGVNSCLVGWNGEFSRDALNALPHEKVENFRQLVDSLISK